MLKRPTALLEHTRRDERHFDWFLADPGSSDPGNAALWAARIHMPSRHWARCRRFDLLILPPHRQVYLSHQGPIGGGRGGVLRIDAGWAICPLWSDSAAVLHVSMRMFSGRIRLSRLSDRFWRAAVG